MKFFLDMVKPINMPQDSLRLVDFDCSYAAVKREWG